MADEPNATDPAVPLYFWLGRIAAEKAEQEAFDADFAMWAYNLDGSGAQKKWREIFPTGDPLDNFVARLKQESADAK